MKTRATANEFDDDSRYKDADIFERRGPPRPRNGTMKNLVLGPLWTRKPDAAALCTIGLLFALNVYRACTRSITADQAVG